MRMNKTDIIYDTYYYSISITKQFLSHNKHSYVV